MFYSLAKKFLFRLDPEVSHQVTLKSLRLLHRCHLLPHFPPAKSPHQVMGLTFPNPVGLAAGLDKNGDYIDALAALGFGFIEVGTITPKPQQGNDKPRLFRLTEQEAIINRMGFNNKGLDYLVERLQKTKYTGVLGINIGKNKQTPNEQATDDYLLGFRRVAPFASYVTINISSPNTQGLRELQESDKLKSLLSVLKNEQRAFQQSQKKYVPLVVKIAPDLSPEQVGEMAEIFLQEKIDGVIATNTTLSRAGVEQSIYASESGGLSGRPLLHSSTDIVRQLHMILRDDIPIIACGGIFSKEDALAKLAAGARLIQIYSGLIFAGPELIREVVF